MSQSPELLKQMGKVYIVGAGVGGVEYLTVKARDLLTGAEAVVYDALADEMLLDLVPRECDRFDVGKRGGRDSMPQTEISNLLVQLCQQGKQVVRLKSGDPLIFGRVVPEMQALQAASCAFELVPGISSAIAAPLFAGLPLTEAAISPCFAVLTGHNLEILPWDALGKMPTLVILMGTANLKGLIAKLLASKSATTAIAIIQWCGRPQQQIWTGTLGDIQQKLPPQSLSPAVIVVGDVVNLQQKVDISTFAPLAHKTILVTRAAGQSSQFTELLTAQGASVIEMPTLAILPPASWAELDSAIANIHAYNWLILTSANAVDSFFARLRVANKDSRALANLKVAVVGRKTAEVLASHGIVPDLVPPNFIAEALADELVAKFPAIQGSKILFPRVQTGGREVLIEQLMQQGGIVEAIAAYESGCPEQIDALALQALSSHAVDMITFASSKTVKHFYQLLNRVEAPEVWQTWIANSKIASIGPQTSVTCRELLGRVDCEAKEYTLLGLTTAIIDFCNGGLPN